MVVFEHGLPESSDPLEVDVNPPTPNSLSHVSTVSLPHVALPLTLGSRLLHSCAAATCPRAASAALASLLAPAHDPTRVEHPTTHVLLPPPIPSVVAAEQGTSASLVMVAEADATAVAWCGSNHGTCSSALLSAAGLHSGKHEAWLTMDSKVPPARGLSHVYLAGEVVRGGLLDTRGRPKPCMANCPFSHVSSATS